MRSVQVLCRPAIRDGFMLAGLQSLPVADGREAASELGRLVARSDVGVVLVEDALYRSLPDELRDALEHRAVPVVLPFPGPRESGELRSAEADLVELLRGAIGYRVRLR